MPVEDMFPLEPVWRNFFETTAAVQVRQLVFSLPLYLLLAH